MGLKSLVRKEIVSQNLTKLENVQHVLSTNLEDSRHVLLMNAGAVVSDGTC